MSKDIVTASNFNLAMVVSDRPTEGAMVEGQDSAGSVSRLAMYQGTAQEEQMYGNAFKRGEFIDALEKRRIGPAFSGKEAPKIRVVPITGFTTWSRWQKGAKIPDYVFKNKNQVPPADLEWTDGPNGQRNPPAASEAVNLIVLVDGEPWPMLLVLKRTGISAFHKVIAPMERRHGHSVYELSSEDDKNAAGQAYKRMTARFVVRSDDATLEAVRSVKAQLSAVMAQVQAMEEKEDDCPI